jgi:ribosome-associated translation inhibitor RaiA
MTVAFDFQFHSEDLPEDTPLRQEAENRLGKWGDRDEDIVGASVAIEELTHEHTSHFWQARVTVFMQPSNLAAVEKADTAEGALKGALDAMERQIRKRRDELRKPWQRPS